MVRLRGYLTEFLGFSSENQEKSCFNKKCYCFCLNILVEIYFCTVKIFFKALFLILYVSSSFHEIFNYNDRQIIYTLLSIVFRTQ